MKLKPPLVSTGAMSAEIRNRLMSAMLTLAVVLAAALSAQTAIAAPVFLDNPDNPCTLSANSANWACQAEIRDDYWIRIGGECMNTNAPADRGECWDEAMTDLEDGTEECADQHDARLDVCDLLGETRYDPEYDSEDFVDPADIGGDVEPNPFMPLIPGSKWVYESEDEIITVEVLDDEMEIDGVPIIVVRDVVEEIEDDGEDEHTVVVEDTYDWFAQDEDGNVWYFGEISLNYEDGQLVDIEGSWKAGEDGAKPGILMPVFPAMEADGADAAVGDVFRQEFLLGDAEDMGMILDLAAMPDLGEDNIGDCTGGCVQFEEWTPLEPGEIEYKFYQSGIGMVQELNPDDGETAELVEFTVP